MSSSEAPCCIRRFFISFPDMRTNPLASKVSLTSSSEEFWSIFDFVHSGIVCENKPLDEMKKKIIESILIFVLYFVNLTLGHTFPAFIEEVDNIRMQIFENCQLFYKFIALYKTQIALPGLLCPPPVIV